MSKNKTKRARRELKRDEARKFAKHHKAAKNTSTSTPSSSKAPKTKPTMPTSPPKKPQASQKPDSPFGTYDHILLVGEGDFSFARALALHHGCANVTATSWDSEDEVREKYPQFASIREELQSLTPPVPIHHSVDARKVDGYQGLRCRREEEGEEEEGWDVIGFMFPHTGGLSTDVNRQVRANQGLLVGFFGACLEGGKEGLKARKRKRKQEKEEGGRGEGKERKEGKEGKKAKAPFLRMGGKVVVALFEGEPYELWNVRDLARHVGLRVVRSEKFVWGGYEGYGHVRTLGTVEGGGGWKGEERAARMYVFEKVEVVDSSAEEEEARNKREKKRKRKRKRGEGEGSESESED
ncbi:hypothetical protein EJ04DRAFT_579918 [Polyplosphaeria fusca]|uniref:25S rRNA (uridine-N(3))-methyltransferase BMT5-like domain-containing protein n=1 Tax=Polyplosphaeria fusca TaxID=682080 RepID=A0A9P4QPN1_9PLEO|nr:hypothetical protein EJ04DRAFT_579918 [Polyplosphaeria fusca]